MRKTYLLLTLLLLCVGISIHAQVTTASMSGKVTDTSSEAMIGVNIKANGYRILHDYPAEWFLFF